MCEGKERKKDFKKKQDDGEQPNERCNRCKILTDDGTARFGAVHDVCVLTQQESRRVQLMRYTAVRDIMKSAMAKKNKVKIVRAGERLYVLGDPAAGSEAEVFVFREGWDVYKRVWNVIKEDVTQGNSVELSVTVSAYGTFDKRRGKCFMAHMGRGKESGVWISERWWERKCAEQQVGLLKSGGGGGGDEGDDTVEGDEYCMTLDYYSDNVWTF